MAIAMPPRRAVRGRDDPGPSVCETVPSRDTLLDTVAANFCQAIQALIEGSEPAHAPLLIAAAHDLAEGGVRLRCWDTQLRASDVPLDPNRRRDREIARTAAMLLDLLRARWPTAVRPGRIGILGDGTGVALAPEDPWPLAEGWIDRRLAHPRGLVALKRFSPDGGLAMLRLPRQARCSAH